MSLNADVHVKLRAALIANLKAAAPKCLPKDECLSCTPFYFGLPEDSVPISPCGCDGLSVTVGDVTQANGSNGCWQIESQLFTVLYTRSWPMGVEPCTTKEQNDAVIRLQECRCSVQKAIQRITPVQLGFAATSLSAGKCHPLQLRNVIRSYGPKGGCAGWIFQIDVGV
jgi:hypothetical protein